MLCFVSCVLFFQRRKIRFDLLFISGLFQWIFQMSNAAFTPITHEKVHRAKMSIENFYANLINQYEEREERFVLHLDLLLSSLDTSFHRSRYRRLEETMNAEGLTEQEVKAIRLK